VKLWRAHLVLNELRIRQGAPTGRPIESFGRLNPRVIVEFDGSPKGIGYRLFSIDDNSEHLEDECGSLLPFDLRNDPQYQNTMEITAAVAGLLRAIQIWGPDLPVHFRGDSETAISWLHADMTTFKSHRARGASMFLTVLRADYGAVPDTSATNISSEANFRADKLSRGEELTQLGPIPVHRNHHGSHTPLTQFLELCNPLTQPNSDSGYIERWTTIRNLCLTTLGGPDKPPVHV
jgi:hypothetical protein